MAYYDGTFNTKLYEDKRPSWDLSKPILSKDTRDLIEKPINLGVELTDMEYNNSLPSDFDRQFNACSDTERERIRASSKRSMKVLQKSMANYDERIFRKWFGKGSVE